MNFSVLFGFTQDFLAKFAFFLILTDSPPGGDSDVLKERSLTRIGLSLIPQVLKSKPPRISFFEQKTSGGGVNFNVSKVAQKSIFDSEN